MAKVRGALGQPHPVPASRQETRALKAQTAQSPRETPPSARILRESFSTPYMDEALKQLVQEGQAVNGEDLKHVWPTRFEHINVYGKYEFNLEDARQRNGLRELRRPDELSP